MKVEEMVDALQSIQEWCRHHTCECCPFMEDNNWGNCMFVSADYGKIPLDWDVKSLKHRFNIHLRKERSSKEMSRPMRTKSDIEIRDWVFAYSPDLKQWVVGKWAGHNQIVIVTQETSPRAIAVDVVNDGFYEPLAWAGEVDCNGYMLFDTDQMECAGVIATIVWDVDKREWMIIPWRGDERLEEQRLTDALAHGEWEKL